MKRIMLSGLAICLAAGGIVLTASFAGGLVLTGAQNTEICSELATKALRDECNAKHKTRSMTQNTSTENENSNTVGAATSTSKSRRARNKRRHRRHRIVRRSVQ